METNPSRVRDQSKDVNNVISTSIGGLGAPINNDMKWWSSIFPAHGDYTTKLF